LVKQEHFSLGLYGFFWQSGAIRFYIYQSSYHIWSRSFCILNLPVNFLWKKISHIHTKNLSVNNKASVSLACSSVLLRDTRRHLFIAWPRNFQLKEEGFSLFWFGLDKCRVPTKTTLITPPPQLERFI